MLHARGSGWTFHPYEITLVGYQNSGKTNLASRLVPLLGLKLAYLKLDPEHHASSRPGSLDPILSRIEFLEYDAVLVEGHEHSMVPKIVVLDEAMAIAADPAFAAQAPLATVGPWTSAPPLPWPVPYFCQDDAEGVAAFIRAHWDGLTARRPLLGLVLAGGRSSRMGEDKAAMTYGEAPESQRVYDLLGEFCSQVFVSCRADQADLPGRRGLPQIHDVLLDKGPLSGILSAFEARPDASWLVVACDLPRVDRGVLVNLVTGRNPFRFATAFRGYQGFPEPLCAVYEPKARARLWQFLAAGLDCPRKMMINSPVQILEPVADDLLANVNTPHERTLVMNDLGR